MYCVHEPTKSRARVVDLERGRKRGSVDIVTAAVIVRARRRNPQVSEITDVFAGAGAVEGGGGRRTRESKRRRRFRVECNITLSGVYEKKTAAFETGTVYYYTRVHVIITTPYPAVLLVFGGLCVRTALVNLIPNTLQDAGDGPPRLKGTRRATADARQTVTRARASTFNASARKREFRTNFP